MQEFMIFFDNGTNVVIKADKIIDSVDSDNYINFFNYAKMPEDFKDSLVAQFAKNKIAGYSKRNTCEVQ